MRKLLLISITLSTLLGCANKEFAETVDALRDDAFTEGCVTDNIIAKAGLGIYGQGGDMEGAIFKLKCSPNLPDNYCFKYKNPVTGSEAQAGEGCDDDEPQEVIIVEPRSTNRPRDSNRTEINPYGSAPKEF